MRVKTAVGLTEYAEVGEIIGQGTGGGALVSAANLDGGVSEYFNESGDEIYYGNIRLQCILFQDDIIRLSSSVSNAKAGNAKLQVMANSKCLEMHPDKTVFVSLGIKKQIKAIEEEVNRSPIYSNNFVTKKKVEEKWLGDKIHEEGLEKSVEATIKMRSGKIMAAIYEVKAIV